MGELFFVVSALSFPHILPELSGKKDQQQRDEKHGGEDGKAHEPNVVRHQAEHKIPHQKVVHEDVERVPPGIAAGLDEAFPPAVLFQQGEEGAAGKAHKQGGDNDAQGRGTEIIPKPGGEPAVKGEPAQGQQEGPAKPGKHRDCQNGRAGEKTGWSKTRHWPKRIPR